MTGTVFKSTGSWYEIMTEQGKVVTGRLRGKFKLDNKKITNPVAVGDKVQIEAEDKGEDTWVIKKIVPRENYIIRKSVKKTEHSHILAANVDQVMVMATISFPRTSLGFIDRVLVTAETYRIPSSVIWNKADLLSKKDEKLVRGYITTYESIGYSSLLISSLNKASSEKVVRLLKNKTTLIVGHSGVGKSTLLNQLIPGLDLKTGEVSTYANKGVHTTTFAEMFVLDKNTFVIDSPGIKELGLSEIYDEELGHYFPEMRHLLGQCKFNNCTHTHEPKCVVREALETGEIAHSRFKNYLSMLYEEDTFR